MFRSLLVFRWSALVGLGLCGSLSSVHAHTSHEDILRILSSIREWQKEDASKLPRAFVSIANAQSIDGKLAIFTDKARSVTSSNYPISGPESKFLTHALRSIHDGILIGGRTLSIDNPQLNNRLWNDSTGHQPRPIILDTHLQHIRSIPEEDLRISNKPIVCCAEQAAEEASVLPYVSVLACPLDPQGRLSLAHILREVRSQFNVRSIMVEGGPRLLSSIFKLGLVDCVCITVAPQLLGDRGLGLTLKQTINFREPSYFTIGSDLCILAELK